MAFMVLLLPRPFLRLCRRLGCMALAWATTKQLQVVVVVAAALFQRNNVVAFMIHPYRTTAGTCELVPLHDAAPGCHPCATCNALGASRLCLQRGQSRCRNGREPVRQSLQLHSFLPLSRPSELSYAMRWMPAGSGCVAASLAPSCSACHRTTLSRWWGRSLPSLMTCAHTQELQRTLPGARRISLADEPGCDRCGRATSRTKPGVVCVAAHERKSPTRRTGRGLCRLHF